MKRIKTGPSSLTLTQLVEFAQEKFGLPQFQRPLTWKWPEQRELLNSLTRKVPIGTLMIWEYNKKRLNMPKRPFDKIHQKEKDIQYLVLDGQQRVNFITLLHLSSLDKYYLNELNRNGHHIYVHLDEDGGPKNNETFSLQEHEKDYCDEDNIISVQYLLKNGRSNMNRLRDGVFKDHENKSLISDVYEGLKDTEINIFNLGEDIDYKRALLIYERVNLAGKRLSGIDVTEAVYISKHQELFQKLKTDQAELAGLNGEFGKIFSRKRILNNMTVDLFNTISARPKQLDVLNPLNADGEQLRKEEVEGTYKLVIDSLKWLKRQLQTYFFLRNDKTITTDYPIIVAATHHRFCQKNGYDVQIGPMMKWLALAILHNRYAGKDTNSKMDKDLALANSQNPWKSLTKNLGHNIDKIRQKDCGDLKKADSDILYKNPKSTWIGTLYTAALLWNSSRDFFDLTTYRTIEENRSKEMEWHHIFPVSQFTKNKELKNNAKYKQNESIINHIGNCAHITKKSNRKLRDDLPKQSLLPLRKTRPDELGSHWLLEVSEKYAFEESKFTEFLATRTKHIVEGMNKFLSEISLGSEQPKARTYPSEMQLLRDGSAKESQTIEFKESYRVHADGPDAGTVWKQGPKAICKELCAFLNSGGGVLFVGVQDNPVKPVGLERDLIVSENIKTKEDLTGNLVTAIKNHLVLAEKSTYKVVDFINFDFDEIDGVEILWIRVHPLPKQNCLLKEKRSAKTSTKYDREGEHSQPHSQWDLNPNSKQWELTREL